MADAKLRRTRASVKAQTTRIANSINENITAAEAKVKQKRLEELWQSFDKVQLEIEENEQQNAEQAQVFRQECEDERNAFENNYFNAMARAQEAIDRNAGQRQVGHNPAAQNNNEAREVVNVRQNKPKQQLKLPEFSGEYSKWLFFRNNFETTIHQDDELSSMQKHQYLIGVLQGEARKVIEDYSISNENYESAWKLLKDTYDNQLAIIETHVEQLLNMPEIPRDNKVEGIKQLVWHLQTNITSIKSLNQPVEHWNTVIIQLAKKRLDYVEQRDWHNDTKACTPQNMPKLEDFIKFITERCHVLRMVHQKKLISPKQAVIPDRKSTRKVVLTTTVAKCGNCEGDHAIYQCEEFIQLSRRQEIQRKKLCFNCLKAGHHAKECKATNCKHCSKRHNTLLHIGQEDKYAEHKSNEESIKKKVVTHSAKPEVTSDEAATTSSVINHVQRADALLVLSTALVYVEDKDGKQRECRVLLDPGSQSNLITEDLVDKLKLKGKRQNELVGGINSLRTTSQRTVTVKIKSMHTDYEKIINCLGFQHVTERIPQVKLNTKLLAVSKDIQLADPTFYEPGTIDLLVGAGVFWNVLCMRQIKQEKGLLNNKLQKTLLGWIVGGELYETKSEYPQFCGLITNEMLHKQLERFWEQEEACEL